MTIKIKLEGMTNEELDTLIGILNTNKVKVMDSNIYCYATSTNNSGMSWRLYGIVFDIKEGKL
jgi:hypothetical protein